jgi:hypothetical protein
MQDKASNNLIKTLESLNSLIVASYNNYSNFNITYKNSSTILPSELKELDKRNSKIINSINFIDDILKIDLLPNQPE